MLAETIQIIGIMSVKNCMFLDCILEKWIAVKQRREKSWIGY
jgi:hypothetical protein